MSKPELPKTDSISELAEFWDNHDLTDFEDQLEDVPDRVFTRQNKRYAFTLILNAEPNQDQIKRVNALLDDGTISTTNDVPQVKFHREAASLVDAIRSAIADVRKASLDVIRVEITPEAVSEAS